MVYKLYELTYEEVEIVDSGFVMSKDEYNQTRLDLKTLQMGLTPVE